jgi:hypothetical protein
VLERHLLDPTVGLDCHRFLHPETPDLKVGPTVPRLGWP